jgi:hypothetical protein
MIRSRLFCAAASILARSVAYASVMRVPGRHRPQGRGGQTRAAMGEAYLQQLLAEQP